MKIISHRGNLLGSKPSTENTMSSILEALDLGFDVEIDVWYLPGGLFIGHDVTELHFYKNVESFLLEKSDKLWIHCKNIDSLVYLSKFSKLNIFGHINDDFVLTSKRNIFCRPGVKENPKSIIVMPELTPIYSVDSFKNCYGVLTDYPVNIKEGNLKLFTK
jgi:hypothetical protein